MKTPNTDPQILIRKAKAWSSVLHGSTIHLIPCFMVGPFVALDGN